MKNKFSLLCILIILAVINIGCSTAAIKSTYQSDSTNYSTFTKHVSIIKNSLHAAEFKLITEGENLNMNFTTFPDGQKLDPRKHDGVNGNPTLPSRYEFYYTNQAKTILIRLNLIYCPEFTHTRIITLHNNGPKLNDVAEQNQNLISSTDTTYLIAFKGGIAEVDTMFTKNGQKIVKGDAEHYLFSEGENKFLPALETILLSFN